MTVPCLRCDAGYTLIELMVALMLLSFVGLAAAGGLQFGTRVWEHSDKTLTAMQTVEQTQTILRALLASATPHRADGLSSFEGFSGDLAFDAPSPRAFPVGGLAHFELMLLPTAVGTRVALRVTSLADTSNVRDASLGEYEGDLHISYLDMSGRTPAWLAVWRDRERLPDAIRIEDDRGSSDMAWPAFIARLPVAQDADCVFDPVATDCRKS